MAWRKFIIHRLRVHGSDIEYYEPKLQWHSVIHKLILTGIHISDRTMSKHESIEIQIRVKSPKLTTFLS